MRIHEPHRLLRPQGRPAFLCLLGTASSALLDFPKLELAGSVWGRRCSGWFGVWDDDVRPGSVSRDSDVWASAQSTSQMAGSAVMWARRPRWDPDTRTSPVVDTRTRGAARCMPCCWAATSRPGSVSRFGNVLDLSRFFPFLAGASPHLPPRTHGPRSVRCCPRPVQLRDLSFLP